MQIIILIFCQNFSSFLTEKSLKNPILIDEINKSKLQLFESELRT